MVTPSGNRYILSIIDVFTRYSEAVPIKDQTARNVADAIFQHVICRYGCPEIIVSDRGANFTSSTFQDLCDVLRIKHNITTAYRPCANSVCERFNKSICSIIARISKGNNGKWDEHLAQAVFAYNNATHTSTGESPAFLLFGFDPRVPQVFPTGQPTYNQLSDYRRELLEKLNTVRNLAYSRGRRNNLKNRERCNIKRKGRVFSVGERVWLLRKHQGRRFGKFSPKYSGPFRITRILGPVTAELGDGSGGKKCIVHFDRLKPYCSYAVCKGRGPYRPKSDESPNRSDDDDDDGEEEITLPYGRPPIAPIRIPDDDVPPENLPELDDSRQAAPASNNRYHLRSRRVDYYKLHHGL
ncbi:uncharacterized protein LOC111620452 [Centruroides sculpturatus]|uniref:uncharacterized protein LOC111620452 n=1 Tax=Centruroides sculpturatus TaxID=218467 RepID=UPI000C6D1BE8|nr:uncharacterized protein LOC111620452 [Centruroides sculpturatus]